VASAAAVSFWQSYQRQAFARIGTDRAPVEVVDHGPLPPEVRESSGLAVSRAYPGVFWTQNDSGDEPRLYALDSTAALIATVEVDGAEAIDWEALDIGPCPGMSGGERWCVYVADTGDNARQRNHVTVYVVPEPDPGAAESRVAVEGAVRFRYEGGPFDVEALAVGPDGELVVATKGRAPRMWVFRIPSEEVVRVARTEEVLTLSNGVALTVEPDFSRGRWLTGGALDAAGTLLALRTYTEVYFYAWPMGTQPVEAAPTCFLGLLEPNGEAIAFSEAGRLFLTSESPGRLVGHLLEIACDGVRAARERNE
jgi:hypothetical protein